MQSSENEVTTTQQKAGEIGPSITEKAYELIVKGDLSKLTEAERTAYYRKLCESLGLNHLTKPFEYIVLQGKMTLYARKDCTEQLRTLHGISINIISREELNGVYVVTARAFNALGRQDESIGAVPIMGAKGDALANALMKAETKAKRRVTLSICGLGMLDETEIETIKDAKFVSESPQLVNIPMIILEQIKNEIVRLSNGDDETRRAIVIKHGGWKKISNSTEDELKGLLATLKSAES